MGGWFGGCDVSLLCLPMGLPWCLLPQHSSDAAIKQYIKYLDEQCPAGKKFILHDLDEVHLFVANDMARELQQKLDELMERNSYSEFGQLENPGSKIRVE